jgi:hypothetical protein
MFQLTPIRGEFQMRLIPLLSLATVSVAVLSACASAPSEGGYMSELEALRAGCEARGGYLEPTGQSTGRVQTENVCVIRWQASRPGGE